MTGKVFDRVQDGRGEIVNEKIGTVMRGDYKSFFFY